MAISKSRRGAFACVNQSRICRRDLEIVISRVSWHIKSRWCVFHSRAARRLALHRVATPRIRVDVPRAPPVRAGIWERAEKGGERQGGCSDFVPRRRKLGDPLIPHERPARERDITVIFQADWPAITADAIHYRRHIGRLKCVLYYVMIDRASRAIHWISVSRLSPINIQFQVRMIYKTF